MRNKSNKLGHQAPKGYVVNDFNSIEIEGDFAYCKSHNFVYKAKVENIKLHLGLPCYYTDIRFHDTAYNYYENCMLHWNRRKPISLKTCIRKTLNCKNIPVGTVVRFNKSWYYSGKKIDNGFNFKIKKENTLDIEYEINDPKFFKNFTSCERSQKLTDALRANGFIVMVNKNESFLSNMINTVTAYVRDGKFVNPEIPGETAIAYGFGKRIGFSSNDDDFMGYSDGCENILWDFNEDFNKWSQCRWIKKSTTIEEIIEELKCERENED